MKNFPFISSHQANNLLRIAAGLFLAAHGLIRIFLGSVDSFGGYLDSQGFPGGILIAWLLTVVEIAGGFSLSSGYLVRWLCLWFTAELLMGIILVHAPNGWFVVGASTNGMEYSALLIICLIVIAAHDASRTGHNAVPAP